jgi:hypothetical protein
MPRPQPEEAAPYYSKYIDLVSSDDIVTELSTQLTATNDFLKKIPEEKSLHSYAPDKWTIREVVSHVTDCERVFAFRAFWFARGFSEALPGFDQDVCAKNATANNVGWTDHGNEFRQVRLATLSLFRNLPDEAWDLGGTANDSPVTVRALAYIMAGHVSHHVGVIKERYLGS